MILQDPVHMGYTAVKAVVARIQGQTVEPRIATGSHVATRETMKSGKIHDLLIPSL